MVFRRGLENHGFGTGTKNMWLKIPIRGWDDNSAYIPIILRSKHRHYVVWSSIPYIYISYIYIYIYIYIYHIYIYIIYIYISYIYISYIYIYISYISLTWSLRPLGRFPYTHSPWFRWGHSEVSIICPEIHIAIIIIVDGKICLNPMNSH